MTFEVAGASKSAVAAIEKAGGSVTILSAKPKVAVADASGLIPYRAFVRDVTTPGGGALPLRPASRIRGHAPAA